VGIIDHSPDNHGWQGGAVVALGDHNGGFQPWELYGVTGCDTPGEQCQLRDVNRDTAADLVEFVTAPPTSPVLAGATQGDIRVYEATVLRGSSRGFFLDGRTTSSGPVCTGTMVCKLADTTHDGKIDAVPF